MKIRDTVSDNTWVCVKGPISPTQQISGLERTPPTESLPVTATAKLSNRPSREGRVKWEGMGYAVGKVT